MPKLNELILSAQHEAAINKTWHMYGFHLPSKINTLVKKYEGFNDRSVFLVHNLQDVSSIKMHVKVG